MGLNCKNVNKITLLTHLLTHHFNRIIIGDLVYFETYMSFIILKMLSKPVILWTEMWSWPNKTRWKFVYKYLSLLVIHQSDCCIVPGIRSRSFLLTQGISSDKIFISSNPSTQISINKKRINEIKLEYGLDDKIVIFYLGRIEKNKGIEYLLKALKALNSNYQNLILFIGGSGSNYNNLLKMKSRMELSNVFF